MFLALARDAVSTRMNNINNQGAESETKNDESGERSNRRSGGRDSYQEGAEWQNEAVRPLANRSAIEHTDTPSLANMPA